MVTDELKLIVWLDPASPPDVIKHIMTLLDTCRPFVLATIIDGKKE